MVMLQPLTNCHVAIRLCDRTYSAAPFFERVHMHIKVTIASNRRIMHLATLIVFCDGERAANCELRTVVLGAAESEGNQDATWFHPEGLHHTREVS